MPLIHRRKFWQPKSCHDPAASAPSFTTLNPSDKATNITLSGGNLTMAAVTHTSNGDSVRSIANHGSGDYYCEATITTNPTTDSTGVGAANSSFTLDNTDPAGSSNSAIYVSDGNIYGNNGTLLNTGVTFTSGDVIGIEVDVTGKQMRVRKNGGSFSSYADISFITGNLYFLGYNYISVATPGSITMNFGATSYGTAAPGGSSNW